MQVLLMADGLAGTLFLSAIYFSFLKLPVVVLLAAAWAKYCEWADKDALAVNTYRQIWNMGHVAAGLVALACILLIPNFAIGAIVGWIVFLGEAIGYVVHRNGLVTPEFTLLTSAHLKRIQDHGLFGKSKKKEKEIVERVVLRGPKGVLKKPEEDAARVHYANLQEIFHEFLLRRATRVDIVPTGELTKIGYEIDGSAVERDPLDRPSGEGLIEFVKYSLGFNLEEKRKPQNGKFMAKLGSSDFDLRIRTDGSTAGEKMSIRVIGAEAKFKAADLGFTPAQLKDINEMLQIEQGMLLIGGPPQSGITTTIYSLTRSHDAFLKNIQLLEYATELDIDNVTQRAFVPKEGVTFTDELLKMIRSDPDVLVVPQIREPQAPMQMAKAAPKIKIVTSIPSTSIADTIARWMRLNNDNDLVAKGLYAVTNQRLVRKLCPQCREAYKPDAASLKKLNLPAEAVLYRAPQPVYDKNGNPINCPNCQGTGFIGRTGIYETLIVGDDVRELIRRGATAQELQSVVSKGGNTSLQRQGFAKVLDGTTSIDELVRVLKPPAAPAGGAKTAVA